MSPLRHGVRRAGAVRGQDKAEQVHTVDLNFDIEKESRKMFFFIFKHDLSANAKVISRVPGPISYQRPVFLREER